MRRRRAGLLALLLPPAACGPAAAPSAASSSTTSSSAAAPSVVAAPSTSSAAAPSTSSAAPSAAPSSRVVPRLAPRPVTAPVVVIDPGHNGGNASHPAIINAPVPDGTGGTKACNTTGTATNAGYPEHAFTWDVALRLRDRLTAAGVRVVLTRPDDTGVGPCVDVRGRLGARVGAVAFVGIHGDGAAASGRGFHVITSSLAPGGPAVATRSSALAVSVRDAMTAVEPVSNYLGRNGLDVRGDLAGLNLNTVPAVYVECGNMRNAQDAALMTGAAGRAAIADRLAAGLLRFLGR